MTDWFAQTTPPGGDVLPKAMTARGHCDGHHYATTGTEQSLLYAPERVTHRRRRHQSPSVNNEALPPAAVVLMVMVFSVAKRGR